MKKQKEKEKTMELPPITRFDMWFRQLPSAKIEMVNVDGNLIVDKVHVGILSHQWKDAKFFFERVLPRFIFSYLNYVEDKKKRRDYVG